MDRIDVTFPVRRAYTAYQMADSGECSILCTNEEGAFLTLKFDSLQTMENFTVQLTQEVGRVRILGLANGEPDPSD